MKKLTRLTFMMIFCLTFTLIGYFPTTAQTSHNADPQSSTPQTANQPWYTEYVHQAQLGFQYYGNFPALIYNHEYGVPEIFYYNQDHIDLFDAIRNDTGCPGSLRWDCSLLAGSQTDAGVYVSADSWTGVGQWKSAVSYHDLTNNALKVALTTITNGIVLHSWLTIEQGVAIPPSVGRYSSLKFYDNGEIGIAYSIAYPDFNIFKYAHSVASGGNCGVGGDAGLWECEVIYTGGLGNYNSLDIAWNNIPVISTYDTVFNDLWVVYYVESGGVCGSWECVYIDGAGGLDVGISSSISAPQQPGDPVRIAYYDKTNQHLKFYNSISGSSIVVDDMGSIFRPGLSLAIDQENLAVIAYQRNLAINNDALRIARPYLAFHDKAYGNCGDLLPGQDYQYWRCSTIDAGDNLHFEALYVSAMVLPNNIVGIAYTEDNEELNAYSLKYASQFNLIYLPLLLKH